MIGGIPVWIMFQLAGDCGRVVGAAISEVSGHLAALETVYQLGVISKVERDNLSQPSPH